MRIVRWLLVVLAAVLAWMYVGQARWVYPTAETQSFFLKTYAPNQVLARFVVARHMQLGSGRGDGAGEGFVTHEADFEPTLLIRTGDWVALNQALRDDIVGRLTVHEGDIVHESGNAIDGFKIRYVMGKSEGTITLEPLQSLAGSPLGPGADGPETATVRAHIRIDEKWFKGGRKETTKVASRR